MKIFIDTCVLPRAKLETAKIYREKYGKDLGFELLPMFDLKDFEDNLEQFSKMLTTMTSCEPALTI